MFSKLLAAQIILYVDSQERSKKFYQALLRNAPTLDVPGMTEFSLSETCRLGLMPNDGIAKILSDKTPHPSNGTGIPRCELYLEVSNVEIEYNNALQSGAKLIESIYPRDWGYKVCYFADPDGHIIAFAEKI